jgi:hypothetical protein
MCATSLALQIAASSQGCCHAWLLFVHALSVAVYGSRYPRMLIAVMAVHQLVLFWLLHSQHDLASYSGVLDGFLSAFNDWVCTSKSKHDRSCQLHKVSLLYLLSLFIFCWPSRRTVSDPLAIYLIASELGNPLFVGVKWFLTSTLFLALRVRVFCFTSSTPICLSAFGTFLDQWK